MYVVNNRFARFPFTDSRYNIEKGGTYRCDSRCERNCEWERWGWWRLLQNELHTLCLWLPSFHPTVYFHHTYTQFSACTFEIMFVVFFRLFLLVRCACVRVCVWQFFFVAPFTSSFVLFFQFCFIFIMGSTKGNAIAILFVTSMVSFGFDMVCAHLCELVRADAAHFDKATSSRHKNTMITTQSVKQNWSICLRCCHFWFSFLFFDANAVLILTSFACVQRHLKWSYRKFVEQIETSFNSELSLVSIDRLN